MVKQKLFRILLCLILFSILVSCTKDEVEEKKNYFTFEGQEIDTPFCLYIEKEIEKNSNYTLYFYTEQVSYSFNDSAFYFSNDYVENGKIIAMQLSESIFESNNSEYSIDNLRNDISIDIIAGEITFYQWDGIITHDITNGTLSQKNDGNKYSFEYSLETSEEKLISGNFTGGMLVHPEKKSEARITILNLKCYE